MMKVNNVVEEWEIQNDDEEVTKLEKEAKKLVPEKFHKWIQVFRKKQNKRMPKIKVSSFKNN